MRTKQAQRRDLDVHLGTEGRLIGQLYLGSGKRSAFRYDEGWLRDPRFFTVSPDLQPVSGVQHPQGVFFRALEDTAPDAWGERVIRRAHAKSRQQDRDLPPLAPVDFLTWVDDEPVSGRCACSILRVGPICIQAPIGLSRRWWIWTRYYMSTGALEEGLESAEDLQYRLGQGSLLEGHEPNLQMGRLGSLFCFDTSVLAISLFFKVSELSLSTDQFPARLKSTCIKTEYRY